MRRGPAVGLLAALAALLSLGCGKHGDGGTIVDVKVELSYRAAEGSITALRATVDDGAHMITRDFSRSGKAAISFPATFGIELAPDIDGPLRIEVRGLDGAERALVRGVIESQVIVPRTTQSARLFLECFGACPGDAGPDARAADAGADAASPADGDERCGNAMVNPGETCDVAIARGQPGACPPLNCDDGIACTIDTRRGSRCTAECLYSEIRTFAANDGCCPAGATHLTDTDCSATCGNGTIEPGEFCDPGIAAGLPTACPIAANCPDSNACTADILISANTCNAFCAHREITAFIANDGCCPAGATHITDSDCPVVCGNGIVEGDETCDTGRAPGQDGACPPSCKVKDPCIKPVIEGSGCMAICRPVPITQFIGGDGCCPAGGNRSLDPDCAAECGNGVLEPGETCDPAIAAGMPGACPTACASDPCMRRTLQGLAIDCTARCVANPITACSSRGDGCCPAGCNAFTNPDCSPTCGNGIREAVESCDTAIPVGQPGACPTSCNDGDSCTTDMLLSAGTCSARCQQTPITAFASGDGCCPTGGNHNLDGDCPFVCGNGVVETPKEMCNRGITPGAAGACPTTCPAPSECKKYSLQGDTTACTARCEPEAITTCAAGDSCCPPGCNRSNDTDCPAVCGDGVLDNGEACDKGITAGNPGACAATCDDNDPCTSDATSGRVEDCTRTCTHTAITACSAGDRCCPTGCDGQTDSDCVPVCGNGVVESAETCDPASSCPTTCADDGDVCTAEKLSGLPATCNVTCLHVPITMCSGATADHCCPTGCSAKSDSPKFDTDCAGTSTPQPGG